MKRHTRLLCAAVLFTIAGIYTGCSGPDKPPEPTTEWTLAAKSQPATRWFWLFAGKNLDRWIPRGGDAHWKIEEGAITAVATHTPSYIATVAEYDNFALTVDFRAEEGHDGGIVIRGPAAADIETPVNAETGYEINIADHHPSGYNTGSVVGMVKHEPATATAGRWNNIEITANGDHIIVKLNRQVTADFRDSTHTNGVIAFQASGKGKVMFRHIKFRDLE